MSIGRKYSRPNARILLVGINTHGLSARRTILEEEGYTVVARPCPCKALESFGAEPFDILITDYRMPGMNGAQLIAKIREHRPDIPIVLISGIAETIGLNESNTGADFVIQKGQHEVTMMLRAVERLLIRARAPRKPAASQNGAVRHHRSATRQQSARV